MLEGPVAPAGEEHFGEYQDLRTVGVSLNAVLRLPAGAFSPYLLAGVGAYRLQRVDSPKSPYGTTGALQAGFGVDASLSPRISAFVEARAQIHITDYGVSVFGVTTICPLVVGGRAR